MPQEPSPGILIAMRRDVPQHGRRSQRRLLWHPPSSRSAGTLQAFPQIPPGFRSGLDAARAYRGGGGAPGRFAVGIHGAPL